MMHFDVLTLFPEMFAAVDTSIVGRAREKGLVEFNFVNIRDFSNDKHNKADDYPFGGGPGMLMMADPIFGAMGSVDAGHKKVIYMSPRGRVIDKDKLVDLSREEELVILCGHYEGVDQRALDYWDAEEISIGDYVLTGGELPAMVLIDALARLVPGVLASEEAATEESIYSGLLEYPQYTKPRNYQGMEVPEVLTNGNHKLIHLWNFEEALKLTRDLRPDLFEEFVKNHRELNKDEQKVMEKVINML
ncbi:tRNA (guanosine(37)-N1)-methyltransferase TrmD [Aminicella lysinilytica]|uniref:tRNA (guanine-N(1)-)-methyltransferase n=1 Tax=Aminicella lysinilytica TaxID=433323 RepID=A0A4R6Q3W0_9FIRM|nr:tRNA (guanine37-N1)-methyltransferase [Aminicella lysinilytica]